MSNADIGAKMPHTRPRNRSTLHVIDKLGFGPVDCSPPHVVLSAVDDAAQAAIDTMRRELVGK